MSGLWKAKDKEIFLVLEFSGKLVFPREEQTNWLSNITSLKTYITSNSIWSEQVVFKYLYTYMYVTAIKEKEAMNLKQNKVLHGKG